MGLWGRVLTKDVPNAEMAGTKRTKGRKGLQTGVQVPSLYAKQQRCPPPPVPPHKAIHSGASAVGYLDLKTACRYCCNRGAVLSEGENTDRAREVVMVLMAPNSGGPRQKNLFELHCGSILFSVAQRVRYWSP